MTQYSGKVIRKTPVTPTQQSASGVWKLNEQAAAIRNNSWPVAGVPDPISRSVRLRSSASAYLAKTFATTGTGGGITSTFSAWVKRGTFGSVQTVIGADATAGTSALFGFDANNCLTFLQGGTTYRVTSAVFRDPSAWYHLVFVWDSSNATDALRCRIYVNGVLQTYSTSTTISLNTVIAIGYSRSQGIGADTPNTGPRQYFDGYMTEINFIDGQALTPSSFGTTNTLTGAWIPMPYTGTYGANGFYLNFKDNTSTTTLGYDYSGNANNWQPNNISLTSGSTYDSMLDVPTPWVGYSTTTDTSAVVRGNYAVASPINQGSYVTLSNGNLTVTGNTVTNSALALGSIGNLTSGKWYWEYTQGTVGSETCGIVTTYTPGTSLINGENIGAYGIGARASGAVYGGTVGSITSWTTGDVIGLAVDCDNGAIYWSKNGTWLNSGVPTSGASKTGAVGVWTPSSSINVTPAFGAYNGGFVSVTFGQRPLTYTPPTGFKTLCTTNLTTPAITNGANYMAASLYTGNGTSQSIVNSGNNTAAVSFKPDLIWTKGRSGVTNHSLVDSVRGSSLQLSSNQIIAEVSDATEITAFNTNGFSVGNSTGAGISVNANGTTYVGWQWQAGQGTTSSNTSGSITSTVSVNTTAGFSVVTYTGTGANATVGHGLGVAPNMVIVKNRSAGSTNWCVYHSSLTSAAYSLFLDNTLAQSSYPSVWNSTAPTLTVFSLGTNGSSNASTNSMVAYCWAAVAGYSAFGSYTGNGSADGPFVYLGFRPRWILIKDITAGGNWIIADTSRNTYNTVNNYLYPNLSDAEFSSSNTFDILSNGLKIRTASSGFNTSSDTYIYAAFAENPFKFSNAR
jgi:hypothetical protein